MRQIREAEWFGEQPPAGAGQPALHLVALAVAGALRLRGHPGRRGRRPRRPARLPPRRGRGDHATGRPGRARPRRRSVAGRRARPRGRHRGAPAVLPARARRPGPARRARARRGPDRRLRRPRAAGGPGHPRARLGQPALLPAAGLAGRGPGAARDLARRRRHGREHLRPRGGPRHRSGLRHRHRGRSARTTRPARSSTGSPQAGSGPAASPPSTPSSPGTRIPCPAGRGAVPGAEDHRRRRPRPLGPARGRHRPPGPRLHAGARRLDDLPRRAARRRARSPSRTTTGWRPAACASASATCSSARRRSRCGWSWSAPAGKREMPAADWARGRATRRTRTSLA